MSDQLEDILALTPEIICKVNNDKIYTWMNRAGIHFFGEGVIGKEMSYFLCDSNVQYKNIQDSLKEKDRVFCITNWQLRKDGEKRLFSWWRKVLRNEFGAVVGELLTGRDITERKLIEIHKDELIGDLKKRNKELDCLYSFSKMVQASGLVIDDVLLSTPMMLLEGLSNQKDFSVELIYVDKRYITNNFKLSKCSYKKEIFYQGELVGELTVFYNKKLGYLDSDFFTPRQTNLIDALADNLAKTVERIKTSKEIITERQKLKEANITLKTVLEKLEEEKNMVRENVALNIEKNIMPLLVNMETTGRYSKKDIDNLKNNLDSVSSEFYKKIVNLKYNLTPAEIEICRLVKAGHLSKKIAEILNISYTTVTSHKRNVRKKLSLNNTKTNLKTYLNELL